jgi:transcriptional regulator with XRE-family HTH domain
MTNKHTPYKTEGLLTDEATLLALGQKLRQLRLQKNITQTELAKESGVAKRTIERFEKGASVQLTSFVRMMRTLGLLDDLLHIVPDQTESPMAKMLAEKQSGYASGTTQRKHRRQRASKKQTNPPPPSESAWEWGE